MASVHSGGRFHTGIRREKKSRSTEVIVAMADEIRDPAQQRATAMHQTLVTQIEHGTQSRASPVPDQIGSGGEGERVDRTEEQPMPEDGRSSVANDVDRRLIVVRPDRVS